MVHDSAGSLAWIGHIRPIKVLEGWYAAPTKLAGFLSGSFSL